MLGDKWQAMCHKACKGKCMSTCMPMEKSIKGEGNQFVEKERNKKEMKEKKKERKRRKGERKRGKRKSAFRWSELVGSRSKVRILDEGYTLRGRDSSYFWFIFYHKGCGVVSFP